MADLQESTRRRAPLTVEEVLALPVTVDLDTVSRCFGFERHKAYRLIDEGTFPVPVHRFGRALRVLRADLLRALGITDTVPTAGAVAPPFVQLFGEPTSA